MPSRTAPHLICVGEYIIEFVTKCLVYRRQSLRIDPEYLQSRRERKKVETLFAHLKRILRLNRLRLRGPSGAKDAFLLAAIAQNLPKLAKLVEPQFGCGRRRSRSNSIASEPPKDGRSGPTVGNPGNVGQQHRLFARMISHYLQRVTWGAYIILLLSISAFRIVDTYPALTHTYDEPAHLAAGIELLDRGTIPTKRSTRPWPA
jgi:hypothetical protein